MPARSPGQEGPAETVGSTGRPREAWAAELAARAEAGPSGPRRAWRRHNRDECPPLTLGRTPRAPPQRQALAGPPAGLSSLGAVDSPRACESGGSRPVGTARHTRASSDGGGGCDGKDGDAWPVAPSPPGPHAPVSPCPRARARFSGGGPRSGTHRIGPSLVGSGPVLLERRRNKAQMKISRRIFSFVSANLKLCVSFRPP